MIHKKGTIKASDTITGIVFITIFAVLLLFVPKLFGAYVFEHGKLVRTIPVFNMEKWSMIRPLFAAAFIAALFDEYTKLREGRYSKRVLLTNLIMNGIQIIIFVFLFKFTSIWNPAFATDVSSVFGYKAVSKGDLLYYWNTNTVSNVVLGVLIGITLLEMLITVYKTVHWGNNYR